MWRHLFIFSNIEHNENNNFIDEKYINENEIILSAFYIKKLLNNNNQNYNLNLLKIVSSKYSDETQFLEKLEIWLSLGRENYAVDFQNQWSVWNIFSLIGQQKSITRSK